MSSTLASNGDGGLWKEFFVVVGMAVLIKQHSINLFKNSVVFYLFVGPHCTSIFQRDGEVISWWAHLVTKSQSWKPVSAEEDLAGGKRVVRKERKNTSVRDLIKSLLVLLCQDAREKPSSQIGSNTQPLASKACTRPLCCHLCLPMIELFNAPFLKPTSINGIHKSKSGNR